MSGLTFFQRQMKSSEGNFVMRRWEFFAPVGGWICSSSIFRMSMLVIIVPRDHEEEMEENGGLNSVFGIILVQCTLREMST
mmetsp:Transcript_24957/g.41126  ORF Transcript_24957/g.41126 Transcript_24957/m.41126 type:complete len:81 (+) Transcript_24957:753-995(+)